MAAEWKPRPLGELTDNFDHIRVPVKEPDRRPGPYPYFGASGVVDHVDGYLFDGEYLLIAEDGENLRTRNTPVAFMAHGQFWVNNHAHIVRGNRESDTRYLMYALAVTDISGYLTGSTMPKLTQGNMNRIPVIVPPLNDQQAIACILGTLDDKIELNRRRNRTLEAMARAIFQSWFVDFDPVRANAQRAGSVSDGGGEAPSLTLPARMAALFPDSFEDSALGPIPKGWRVGTFGDLTEINGWTLNKRDHLDEIDYIEISEVMQGEIANVARYTRGSEPGRARRRLRHGDTAISTVRPDRGSYFLSLEPALNLIASTGFAVLTAKTSCWAFVHVLATGDDFGQELGRLADGGAYPAVRPEVIAARPVVIPASELPIAAFEKVAQPVFLRAEAGRKESRTLAALRDALLPKLISGELRVPDAEQIVGRAT